MLDKSNQKFELKMPSNFLKLVQVLFQEVL